jgi:hypothetical protein
MENLTAWVLSTEKTEPVPIDGLWAEDPLDTDWTEHLQHTYPDEYWAIEKMLCNFHTGEAQIASTDAHNTKTFPHPMDGSRLEVCGTLYNLSNQDDFRTPYNNNLGCFLLHWNQDKEKELLKEHFVRGRVVLICRYIPKDDERTEFIPAKDYRPFFLNATEVIANLEVNDNPIMIQLEAEGHNTEALRGLIERGVIASVRGQDFEPEMKEMMEIAKHIPIKALERIMASILGSDDMMEWLGE